MFEFLAQNFAVAGGVLAAIPVLLHMLRRTPAVRMPFSLVRFLSPTLPRTTRRSRIENWPLMLLRILAVTLIALAFSRPFQRLTVTQDSAAPTGRRFTPHLPVPLSPSSPPPPAPWQFPPDSCPNPAPHRVDPHPCHPPPGPLLG